jgi:hypothetical protein
VSALNTGGRILLLWLTCLLAAAPVSAESLIDEGVREFEELRLRQLQTVQSEGELGAFSSDGCSANLSLNWKLLAARLPGFADEFGDEPPWEDCCVAHDREYWWGSALDGYRQRQAADRRLRQCVVDTGVELAPTLGQKYSLTGEEVEQGFTLIADLMYQAVRLGGQPCSLLPWRWGFGWPNCAFARVADISSEHSDIKADEQLVFFNTAAWLDEGGTHWQIPIHAWVYEPADSVLRQGAFAALLESAYDLKVSEQTAEVFSRRSNLLLADNERGKRLLIRLAGRDYELPLSEENGQLSALLQLPVTTAAAVAQQGRLRFFALTPAGDERRFEGQVELVSGPGVSVISDIDDTIKITNVTDHRKLFENTFFRDFEVVAGMPELYRSLAAGGARLHFVSSSPWQLYPPLEAFIEASGFPWATLSLKSVRFRDETLLNFFKKGTETKPAQIEPILQRYPERKFILVGDSGEQDPEVYGDIARRYPAQIIKILIRNADGSDDGDQRYRKVFDGIARDSWQLFDDPAQIAADELLNFR